MTRVLRMIARLNIGGPAIHATLLTERLDPSRYTSFLLAGTEEPGEGNYLALHGRSLARLEIVPSLGREIRGPRDLGALGAIVRAVRHIRPHVVHTHTAKAGALGRLAAWLCRVPVVVHTYHGHVLDGYFSPAKTRLFVSIERGLARVSTRLVAVTPQVRDALLAHGIGARDRFEVVPLGFDLEPFASASRGTRVLHRELGIPVESRLVTIVARLVPIKAHDVFLAAAALVAPSRPDVRFLVVGDGERRAELERMAGDLGLAGRVRFLGWRADLAGIYADSDVVGLSSRNEGSPVALIEAMATGCPVVSTRVGGVSDVVSDGETGLLVPPGDDAALAESIGRVLDDSDLARRLGVSARTASVSRYGAERLLGDIDALYTHLLSPAPEAR